MRPDDFHRATRPPHRANMLHAALATIPALIAGRSSRCQVVDSKIISDADLILARFVKTLVRAVTGIRLTSLVPSGLCSH
jgi:hypothetical protein